MERQADRTETASGDPGTGQPPEDEIAREMIARIARQVDLEVGRVPLEPEPEPSGDDAEQAEPPAAQEREEPVDETPVALSEEDVSRQLVERIAREVDEERRG